MAADGAVSLAEDDVLSITKNGEALEPDDQETLWFSVDNPSGQYRFYVTTADNTRYVAVLVWKQP